MKRIITDNGIIVGKYCKEATEDREFKDFKTGETVRLKATPASWWVLVVSAQEIDEVFGMEDPQLQKAIQVDSDTFANVKYLDKCEVDFEWNGSSSKVTALRIL